MMNREELKASQPILYRILSSSIDHQTLPHAFLLVGDHTYEAAMYIVKSILCDKGLACNECSTCKRVEEHNYPDFLYYSGKKESIKKRDVDHIQEELLKSPLEGKAQVYLLENIENSSNESMNSLLKILEEPKQGVYAILTCSNQNKVLPTIQSRCCVLKLLSESSSMIEERLIREGQSQENARILSHMFKSYEDAISIDQDLYIELKEESYQFINCLFLNKDNLVIDVQTHFLMKHKDKESVSLFLNMIVLILRDLFHVKHNMSCLFESFQSLYDKIDVDDDFIIYSIETLLESEYYLSVNANVLLLMDSMLYKLQKGVHS